MFRLPLSPLAARAFAGLVILAGMGTLGGAASAQDSASLAPVAPLTLEGPGTPDVRVRPHRDGTEVRFRVGRREARTVLEQTLTPEWRREAGEGVAVALRDERGRQHVLLALESHGGAEVVWRGETSARGDRGERRWDVLVLGTNVVVGRRDERRELCGAPYLLERQVLREGSLVPSPILPPLTAGSALAASSSPPEGLTSEATPRLGFSAGPSAAAELDPALTDGERDASAPAWDGTQFTSARWTGAPIALRALRLTFTTPPSAAVVQVVLDGTAHPLPLEGVSSREVWVALPPTTRARCVGLAGVDPSGRATVVELAGFSDLDAPDLANRLLAEIAGSADESAAASRAFALMGNSGVPLLERAFREESYRGRRRILQILAEIAPRAERARALLLAVAQNEAHRSAPVAEAQPLAALAADTLARSATAEELAQLVLVPEVGPRAARAALRERRPLVAPLLGALVLDPDAGELRGVLANAWHHEADAEEALAAWVPDAPPAARATVALALARSRETQPLALELLSPPPETDASFPSVYRGLLALEAIAESAHQLPEQARNWVEELGQSEVWMLRRRANAILAALHEHAPEEVRAQIERRLLRAVQDGYPRVRADVLARVPAESMSEAIRDDYIVRARRRATRDAWPMVRAGALRSLQSDTDLVVRRLDRDRAPEVRATAIDILRERGLSQIPREGDGSGSGNAVEEGATQSPEQRVWPAVMARLHDGDEWPVVVRAALRFTEARCHEDALPALEDVIKRAYRPRPWAPDLDLAAQALRIAIAIAPEAAADWVQRAAANDAPPSLQIVARAAESVERCSP